MEIINESNKIQDVATLTVGLTSGWWLFEDKENRIKGSPLLKPAKWKQILEVNGVRKIHFFDLSKINENISWQSVIVCESDGYINIERSLEKKKAQNIIENINEIK